MTEEKARKIVQGILLLILGFTAPFVAYFLWELVLFIILSVLVMFGVYVLIVAVVWVLGIPWKEIKNAHNL